MATLRLTIPSDPDWLPGDQVVLMVGSENAADLAASTPAGGDESLTVSVPEHHAAGNLGGGRLGAGLLGAAEGAYGLGGGELGGGLLGVSALPRLTFERRYQPADKSASLPVGVGLRDAAGNQSAVIETQAALADPPAPPGVGAITVTAAGTGAAVLAWPASSDV